MGSAAELLRKRNEAAKVATVTKVEEPEAEEPKEPAKKPVKKPVKKLVKKPAKVKKEPVKVKKEPVKVKPKRTAVKTTKKSKRGGSRGPRNLDRDRAGDGLRPFERELLQTLKGMGKTSIKNLAAKMFRAGKSGIRSEGGPESIRAVRNGIRIPERLGLIRRSERGVVETTAAYNKGKVESKASKVQKKVKKAAKSKK